jgi:hypothetical protein
MDVLGVDEEDGHPWELWGLTSALSGGFLSTKRREMRFLDSLCPCYV